MLSKMYSWPPIKQFSLVLFSGVVHAIDSPGVPLPLWFEEFGFQVRKTACFFPLVWLPLLVTGWISLSP